MQPLFGRTSYEDKQENVQPEARAVDKAPDEKERLKAAELLGKRYGLFKDNVALEVEPVVIVNDLKE